jgi:hypothetical protein
MPLRRLSRRLLEFINPITVAFPRNRSICDVMTTTVHAAVVKAMSSVQSVLSVCRITFA